MVRKIQSKHSVLGLLFEPLLLILSSLAISAVWNKLFGRGGDQFTEFFVYIFVSFSTWYLITDLIKGVTDALRKNAVAATNTDEPLTLYIVLELSSGLLNYLMRLPIMLFLMLVFVGIPSFSSALGFMAGFLLVALAGLGFGLCIGIYSLFYGDLKEVVNSVMRVAFLLTPIIWHIERLGEYQDWIYFNPFFSYLTTCRDLFLGNPVDVLALQISVVLTLGVLILGLFVLNKNKYRARTSLFDV